MMIPRSEGHCKTYLLPLHTRSKNVPGRSYCLPTDQDLLDATRYMQHHYPGCRDGDLVSFCDPDLDQSQRLDFEQRKEDYNPDLGLGIVYQERVIQMDYRYEIACQPDLFRFTDGWPMNYWVTDSDEGTIGLKWSGIAWIEADRVIDQCVRNVTSGRTPDFGKKCRLKFRTVHTYFELKNRKVWVAYLPSRYDHCPYLSKRYYLRALQKAFRSERGKTIGLNCRHYLAGDIMEEFSRRPKYRHREDLLLVTTGWKPMETRCDCLLDRLYDDTERRILRLLDDPELESGIEVLGQLSKRSLRAAGRTSTQAIADLLGLSTCLARVAQSDIRLACSSEADKFDDGLSHLGDGILMVDPYYPLKGKEVWSEDPVHTILLDLLLHLDNQKVARQYLDRLPKDSMVHRAPITQLKFTAKSEPTRKRSYRLALANEDLENGSIIKLGMVHQDDGVKLGLLPKSHHPRMRKLIAVLRCSDRYDDFVDRLFVRYGVTINSGWLALWDPNILMDTVFVEEDLDRHYGTISTTFLDREDNYYEPCIRYPFHIQTTVDISEQELQERAIGFEMGLGKVLRAGYHCNCFHHKDSQRHFRAELDAVLASPKQVQKALDQISPLKKRLYGLA